MTEDKIKVSYFEKIDVIRFLAAMMVVVYHAYERWISIWHYHKFMTTDGDGQNLNAAGKWINTGMLNGGFGVDVFFLISGFLITYLLLKEREAFGKINIFKFYVRRSFRIWPLFYLVIAISPFLVDWLGKAGHPNYLANALFLNNFETIKTHFWVYPLAHMWSLCVEEHFYIIWPFVIAFVPIKRLMQVMVAFVFMSICYRAYLMLFTEEPWYSLFLSTFSRFDALVLGAIVAFRHWQNPIKLSIPKSTRLMVYAVLLIAVCNDVIIAWDNLFLACFKKYLYLGITGFAIMNYLFNEKPMFNFANIKIIRYFGKVSYGIYVFGLIALDVIVEKIMLPNYFSNMYLYWALVISSSLIIPILSFELYEKWFLKLKKRFELLRIEK
jgi:peptidoglycan/LPS O-acetylase OafA/YrhL